MGGWPKLSVALAGCVVCACLAASAASPSFPGPQGRLVYLGETVFGGTTAFEVNADGSGRHQLALPPLGINGGAASSASGFELAYTATVNPFDFPGLPARLRDKVPKFPPSFLGIGGFAPATFGGFDSLEAGTPQAAYGRPAWSPDGTQLAYASGKPGALDIYVQPVGDSSAAVDITPNTTGDDVDPDWSPDGSTIAFASNRGGNYDLYAIDAHGANLRRLTSDAARERSPDWSPDGRALVYASNASGSDQLYTLPAAGGAPTRLTTSDANDRRPAWSPDGKWIAFSSDRAGQDDVYLVDTDGGQLRQLTSAPTEEIVQDWQPVSDTVPPSVTALPSHGRKGRALLRYRVSDNSGIASISMELSTSSPSGSGSFDFNAGGYHRVRAGVVYTWDVARSDPFLSKLGRRFTFCVTALDQTGNTSKTSCAAYRATG